MTIFIILGVALFGPMKFVHAYIDPGTGSYFFQIAMAGIFGALFVIKTFWKHIIKKVKNVFGKSESPSISDTQK